MNARAKNINSWLRDGLSEVDVMVICGMGGIGKTTIAKFVYNLNFHRFQGSSFLANVREASHQPNGLVRLQRQLLSDVLRRKCDKIWSVDEGIVKIKDAIGSKVVFLVLDDVDQDEQLKAVLGMREWLCPGSKIIITTRDESLVKPHHGIAYKLNRVEKLGEDKSLMLFCYHAFAQDSPVDGFLDLSKRVVNHCEGLPLALEVLGCSLFCRSAELWEDALKKLDKIPHRKIQEKLRISYDSLQDDHDQNLFLHIACFFIGKDRSWIATVLEGCEFYPVIGIQNLVDRCLLSIDKGNKVVMHQLLRNMGREIVRGECPFNPGRRSRLWHHKDSFDVLNEEMGSETIEGLVLDMEMPMVDLSVAESLFVGCSKKRSFSNSSDQSDSHKRRRSGIFSWFGGGNTSGHPNMIDSLEMGAFERMHMLKLLKLNRVKFVGSSYNKISKRLRWLCWHGCPLASIPSDFFLDGLIVLDLRYSSLKEVWKGNKYLGSLKILNLSHCHHLLRAPEFSATPNLERLILKDCPSIVSLPESISKAERLFLVNLKDCKSLRRLPRSLSMLKYLETLVISGCSNLDRVPESLKKLGSLKILYADEIPIDQLLPEPSKEIIASCASIWSWVSRKWQKPVISWVSLPRSLVTLSLRGCNLSDDVFPTEFSQMGLLEHLDLSRNPLSSLPSCIQNLPKLQRIDCDSCSRIQSIVVRPIMKRLTLLDCTSLETVTYLSPPPSRGRLAIHYANISNLLEIQNNFKLQALEHLDADKVLNDLAFFINSDSIANTKVTLQNVFHYTNHYLPIQVLYEHGIHSIFLPGGVLPDQFDIRTTGSFVSLTVPLFPGNEICGMNMCVVYSLSNVVDIWWPHPLFAVIRNKNRGLKWIYRPSCVGAPEPSQDLMWLSHWKFGSSQLNCGDEVSVSVVVGTSLQVKECGISFLYKPEGQTSDRHKPDPGWPTAINGDMTKFERKKGVYFIVKQPFRIKGIVQHEDAWSGTDWYREIFQDGDNDEE